jgi:signal peptidase I
MARWWAAPEKDKDTRFYRGRSMAGTFRPGDRLTVFPVPLAEISPGDVVVFRGLNHEGEESELVHRVVAATPDGLVARGDNNFREDEGRVTSDNLVGRVTLVERDGRARQVRVGRAGRWQARWLRARLVAWRLVKRLGAPAYGRLRSSGLVPRCWQPSLSRISLNSKDGVLIKYVHHGRTVARWWPATGRFESRKPFDLVIPRPDHAGPAGGRGAGRSPRR